MKVFWLSTKCTNVEPIFGSLESLNLPLEIKKIFYDQHGTSGWELARAAIEKVRPDIVVYNATASGPSVPSLKDLAFIRKFSKLVMICFDACCQDWHPLLTDYIKNNAFDLMVNIDGNNEHPESSNFIDTLCPIDPRPFTNIAMVKRPIHAGFCGGNGSEERRKIISDIGPYLNVRAREENVGSYAEYAQYLSKCRMVLNMARTGPGHNMQVKARVIEAAYAGCLLLEQKGAPTDKYFKVGVDYLEYESAEEANMTIFRTSTNVAVLEIYRERLNREVLSRYSPLHFWKRVFAGIGMEHFESRDSFVVPEVCT